MKDCPSGLTKRDFDGNPDQIINGNPTEDSRVCVTTPAFRSAVRERMRAALYEEAAYQEPLALTATRCAKEAVTLLSRTMTRRNAVRSDRRAASTQPARTTHLQRRAAVPRWATTVFEKLVAAVAAARLPLHAITRAAAAPSA